MQTRAAYVSQPAERKWPWRAFGLSHVSTLADVHVNQSHSPGSLSLTLTCFKQHSALYRLQAELIGFVDECCSYITYTQTILNALKIF
jgi:hypothetical protein